MMIIGVVGQKFSGKDTFADYLCKHYDFEKKAFASSLKKVCMAAFHLTEEQLNLPEQKEKIHEYWGKSPRELMQMVGTELFRNHFDKEIWTKNMFLDLKGSQGKKIVVSDVRFENEMQFLIDYGVKYGIPVFMIRIERDLQRQEDCHLSEKHSWANEKMDTISNMSTLQEFYEKIDAFMQKAFEENLNSDETKQK